MKIISKLKLSLGKLQEVNEQIMEKFGPKIVYNGSQQQNQDLEEAISIGLIDYPKNKFVILDLPEDQINTKGQFISIKKDFDLDLPEILGTPNEMHQILLNLCINASHSMPDGGDLTISLKIFKCIFRNIFINLAPNLFLLFLSSLHISCHGLFSR